MSFTSTLSVHARTVSVCGCLFFLFDIVTKMKQILQSVVKIIIIGSLFDKTTVLCNRQFLPPPPLPYYHNDDYYAPSFSPPYHEPGPPFHPTENVQPPHQYVNYYSPPQLFHQDKDYHPPQGPKPIKSYPFPQVPPFEADYHPVIPPSVVPQVSTQIHSIPYPTVDSPKFPPSRIIYKVETVQPYYQDNFNKNYHEDDDYSDNYNDDPDQPSPCEPDVPYRYFKTIRGSSDGNHSDFYYPCSYPPNFYGLKTPLTLLPSRFPPRVEQLIERIQNYFSTYTEQETKKPENSTVQPSSTTESFAAVESTHDTDNKNTTEASQPAEQTSTASLPVVNNVIQVTEEPEAEPNQNEQAKNDQLSSTTETGVEDENKSQVDAQNAATSGDVMEDVPTTTETIGNNETLVNEQFEAEMKPQQIQPTEVGLNNENSTVEQMVNELDHTVEPTTVTTVVPESETRITGTEGMDLTTESAKNEHNEEEYNSISTTNEIFHKVADNNGPDFLLLVFQLTPKI